MADKPKKESKAEHIYIDAAGNPVDAIEKAAGMRYKQRVNGGGSVDWLPTTPLVPGSETAMVWCFGAKTLMTNVASSVRNPADKAKPAGSPADELAAINARIATVRSGTFVDLTGLGGVDRDALATAYCNVCLATKDAKGKPVLAKGDYDAMLQKVRAKFDADAEWMKAVKVAEGVDAEYRKVLGRPTKSAADLLGSL